jgi:hypothetical protein
MERALMIVNRFCPKVTSVHDAKRGVKLEVMKQDVVARKKKHDACAFAQACKRQLHLDGAIVSISRAYLIKGKKATRYELPDSVRREITAFDRGGGFAPGQYVLRPISAGHEQGFNQTSDYGPKKRVRPKPRHYTRGIRAILA